MIKRTNKVGTHKGHEAAKPAPVPTPATDDPRQAVSKPKPAPKEKPARKVASKAKSDQSNKGQSKQDRVVAMLRRSDGTTVAAVMKATSWQKHSVHGFFAGVVRKKLGLNLVSEQKDDTRVYRIVEAKHAKAASSVRKRAA